MRMTVGAAACRFGCVLGAARMQFRGFSSSCVELDLRNGKDGRSWSWSGEKGRYI